MLQVISPHLTIDRNAFSLFMAQYTRWLFRIRYACTYHHESSFEKFLKKLPKLPTFRLSSDELKPPRRDPPHEHTNFDFSWGTGPLVDSYGGFYHFLGARSRKPGHEEVEIYDAKKKVQRWTKLYELGDTNEYIHPIAHYRSLVRGWDKYSPLRRKWNRDAWRSKRDDMMRFWWYMDGEQDTCAIPEWAILPDGSGDEHNFERMWYRECEKTARSLDGGVEAEEEEEKGFLEALDAKIDFAFDERPQNVWP